MSIRCECGSWALNDFPESGLCDKCYWKKLVAEAPIFFSEEKSSSKTLWLNRAGIVENVDNCKKCGGLMKPGKAIEQTWMGQPEWPGDTIYTMSPSGPGVLIDCLKCELCGSSISIPNALISDATNGEQNDCC